MPAPLLSCQEFELNCRQVSDRVALFNSAVLFPEHGGGAAYDAFGEVVTFRISHYICSCRYDIV